MSKNLRILLAAAAATALLGAPVLSQAADMEPQPVNETATTQPDTSKQDAQPDAGTKSDTTKTDEAQKQATPAPAPQVGPQSDPAGNCNTTGAMSHGKWTLAPSAEYNGECTLTFTATDPAVENDLTVLNTGDSTYPYSHIHTEFGFDQATHIVFDGVNKTKLPVNSAFLFGDWGSNSYGTLKTFKSNNHVDTSEVKTMQGMFQLSSSLTSLDLSGWDTSNLENMRSMFDGTALTSMDLSGLNVSHVTDMQQLFWGQNLSLLDLSGWDTTHVTNMYGMFNWAHVQTLTIGPKTKIDVSGNDWQGNVTRITKLSDGTTGVTEVTGDTSAISPDSVTNTIKTDANRAGTYTSGALTNRALTLNANLPQGVDFSASAAGYTADGNKNLTQTFPMINASGVPMPTYDANGAMTNHNISHNVTSSNPVLPTTDPFKPHASAQDRTAYVFEGWSTDPSATTATYANGDTFPFTADSVTLYAVWQKHVIPATTDGGNLEGQTHHINMSAGTNGGSMEGQTTHIVSPGTNGGNLEVQAHPQTNSTPQQSGTSQSTMPSTQNSPVAAPAAPTGALAATPLMGGDHSVGNAPHVARHGNSQKQRTCAAAYLQNGLISPAAYTQCVGGETAVASATSPTSTSQRSPFFIGLLAILVVLAGCAITYMRTNDEIVSRHRLEM